MKKYVLSLAITVLSTLAQGQTAVNNTSREFHEKVFKLMAKNVDSLSLDGDIRKGEKLRPILEDLAKYLINPLLGEAEDQNSSVRDLSISCQLIAIGGSSDCIISIQYKPIGETSLLFSILVDGNKEPIAFFRDRIEVVRGD
jgi:hypothetical protein